MTPTESMMVWLPKELYSSVEPLADQRYVWCPMPFDESLPVDQTSFIRVGGDDIEDGKAHHEPTESADSPEPTIEANLPSATTASIDGSADEATGISGSDTEPEKDFAFRRIDQNLRRGRRRPQRAQPLRRGYSRSEKDGRRRGRGFAVQLGLDLDIEVTLKARVNGDLELSACFDDL